MKRIICFLITTSLLCLILAFSVPVKTDATSSYSMKAKAKLTSQTSVKIRWSGGKKLKYWKVRKAVFNKKGGFVKYKTIKTLKRSKKSYTLKKLKKNKIYEFEIVGGIKKKGKFKAICYNYVSIFTGLSETGWDDYAWSDAPCSPNCIELWGVCYNNGFKIQGYEIYRKKHGDSKYVKIATIGKKGFPYKDKKVSPGQVYDYRIRAYGKIKKKKKYSSWSDVLTRGAVNQSGGFRSEVISAVTDELVLKLTSDKYNGVLQLSYDGLSFASDNNNSEDGASLEDWEYPGVIITASSKDNSKWTDVSPKKPVTLAGGDTVYLKVKKNKVDVDFTKEGRLASDCETYNGLPSFFNLTLGGRGTAYMNAEMIH